MFKLRIISSLLIALFSYGVTAGAQSAGAPLDDTFKRLMSEQRYQEALALAEQTTRNNAQSLSGHEELYLVYNATGKPFEVLTESQILLGLANGAPWAAYNHAVALQALGMTALAKVYYDRILDKEPDHFNAKLGRAQCTLALGQERAAVEALERLNKEKPNSPTLLANLAQAYLQYKDGFAAQQSALQALKLDPNCVQASRVLTSVEWQMHKFDQAEESALHFMQIDPRNPEAYMWAIKTVSAVQEGANKAQSIVDKARTNFCQPEQAEFFMLMGSVIEGRGEQFHYGHRQKLADAWYKVAARSYETAVALQPQGSINRERLVRVLVKARDYDNASKQARLVLQINPTNDEAKRVVELYGRSRENDLARRLKGLFRPPS